MCPVDDDLATCRCECHDPVRGMSVAHCVPCCDGTNIYSFPSSMEFIRLDEEIVKAGGESMLGRTYE